MLEPLAEDWERALAIVAHPDDLEYGVASAIARWTDQGKDVAYLLVTRGEAGIDALAPEECARVREAEERASAAVVGVGTVEFLGHADGLVEYGIPLRRDFARAIRAHRPDVVVSINYRDSWGGAGSLNMADHRHTGWAVLDAVRDAANRWVFTDDGAPWAAVRMVCFGASPEPTHFVDVTTTIDRGVASLREHRAYLAHVGGDAEFVREWAANAGREVGVAYATTFEVFSM